LRQDKGFRPSVNEIKENMIARLITFMLILPVFLVTCARAGAASDDISVIPRPVSLTRGEGSFSVGPDTRIVASAGAEAIGHDLAKALAPATGFDLGIDSTDRASNVIRLTLQPGEAIPSEGYRLQVQPDSIDITASSPAGLFYGVQTLRQLLPMEIFSQAKVDHVAWNVPCVLIEDHPHFRWRGMLLDCSRHFMPKEFVERFIDLLALHKMNSFHWHLTDDQGWRIEIKRYPKLTSVGGWRKETLIGHEGTKPVQYDGTRYGGFYTQEDIGEVVRYAADRFINIVPEIEMPGHSAAAIAAYPELGCTDQPVEVWTTWGVNHNILIPTESTIVFYQNVLDEVLAMFPSRFIHLGGDEVPLEQWKDNPVVAARLKELNLKDAAELQRYLLRRMDQFLASRGRRLVGWDEILDPQLPQDAVVMSWRGVDQGIIAAGAGHDVVMAPLPSTYFDHYQTQNVAAEPLSIGGYLPLKSVYAFSPISSDLSSDAAHHILGGQAQIWTEYIPTPDRVEYMAYPRACALAETLWSPRDESGFAGFMQRLTLHLQRLKELGVNYRTPRADD
jgi:hexosaminidase